MSASESTPIAVSASTLPRSLVNDLQRYATSSDVVIGEVRTIELNGESYVTNAIALDERAPPRAMVFTHQSVALANAPFKRLTDLLTLLSVLGVAACALGSSLLAGAIARPIRSLTAMTEAMRAGDSGGQVAGKLTSELQSLADSFNKLIDTLRKRDAEIQHLAYFDPLTALRNRLGFVETASASLSAPQSSKHGIVALFELASSTQISSVLGHEVGDEVIRAVAARLTDALPKSSIVARIGTDEFAAMFSDTHDVDARAILQHVIAQFELPIHAVNQSIDVRIDVGWAQLPEDGSALATVMRRAEIALNVAKARQRSPVRFDHAMEADTHTQFALLSELKLAVAQRELELHYQPKLSPSGVPVGLEALVRWNHPRRGLVMPSA
ncbi:MAG: diguanylate cyclase domain-containing protein, partial [Casimicrobium sp.]